MQQPGWLRSAAFSHPMNWAAEHSHVSRQERDLQFVRQSGRYGVGGAAHTPCHPERQQRVSPLHEGGRFFVTAFLRITRCRIGLRRRPPSRIHPAPFGRPVIHRHSGLDREDCLRARRHSSVSAHDPSHRFVGARHAVPAGGPCRAPDERRPCRGVSLQGLPVFSMPWAHRGPRCGYWARSVPPSSPSNGPGMGSGIGPGSGPGSGSGVGISGGVLVLTVSERSCFLPPRSVTLSP